MKTTIHRNSVMETMIQTLVKGAGVILLVMFLIRWGRDLRQSLLKTQAGTASSLWMGDRERTWKKTLEVPLETLRHLNQFHHIQDNIFRVLP